MKMSSVVAAMSVVVLVACAKKDASVTDSVLTVDSAGGSTTMAPPVPAAWTDANIAALLDEANAGDSAGGQMATKKGTSANVKAFGAMMMRDHHALRVAGLALATKLNVTPMAPSDDSLPAQVKTVQDSLAVMEKGASWDRLYIDNEVGIHTKVLSVIDRALNSTQTAELKALLTQARPNIEMHLKRAQDIQTKLAASSTKG